jgi:dihydrofolate reductase
MGADRISIIGGADVYAQFLPDASEILLTLVHATPEGDAYFPPFEHLGFHEMARERHEPGPEDEYSFTFLTYRRA